ncbi:uncharacterized protein FSUBG_14083 [Fusarium subglutinans]|uniref:Nucleotide-diphospho-sugar transferase domain-containing protein n=1 Tax=Gibberella subglutinans TaxID=42677 RepID=A0A8H5KIT1_GIBSU|nr:uncharacterized protein FSUBG_14083 [Fusarium subglutinans]KAF5574007.1 hypothetical protein FSUBG_14083 [Fusarium subglutinans]
MQLLSAERITIAMMALAIILQFLIYTSFGRHPEGVKVGKPLSPFLAEQHFRDEIRRLFSPTRLSMTQKSFSGALGYRLDMRDEPTWKTHLGHDLLIIDMDTRTPDIFKNRSHPKAMNWETLSSTQAGGIISAAVMNHFLYDKYINAREIPDHDSSWIRPHVLHSLLPHYKIIVAMDTDTTFQHLNLPLEWLFNRWGFVQNHTSIAMPVDTMEVKNGDKDASKDSRGQVVLNAGFIVVQRGEHTMAMLDAWKSCTDGKTYQDCGHWKKNWSHEQRAFSEYIRYDFNSDNRIVSIPCDDAMGYPEITDKEWINGGLSLVLRIQ